MTDRNSEDQQIKVTDKRMFTQDGELREEYKDLGTSVGTDPGQTRPTEPTQTAQPSQPAHAAPNAPVGGSTITSAGNDRGAAPAPAHSAAPQPPADARGAAPEAAEYPSGAQFEDLVALLAQTTVTFLQQASSPRARSESLEQAQLYLDLLGILDDKTRGNLAPAEKAMLQDALRQLRLAFAQRG